jgi:hypothetical protein
MSSDHARYDGQQDQRQGLKPRPSLYPDHEARKAYIRGWLESRRNEQHHERRG